MSQMWLPSNQQNNVYLHEGTQLWKTKKEVGEIMCQKVGWPDGLLGEGAWHQKKDRSLIPGPNIT